MATEYLSTSELLHLGNKNTLDGPGDEYWEELGGDKPKTLFHSPASDREIQDLETRIGMTLPEDYKEFLRASNGFGDEQDGIYDGYSPSAAFHSAEEVQWDDSEFFQLPVDLLELPNDINMLAAKRAKTTPDGDLEFDTNVPLFDRVLEIGVRDIDNIWLVHPDLVQRTCKAYKELYQIANAKQKEALDTAVAKFVGSWEDFEQLKWCCVKWSSGGVAAMSAYKSFRAYLEALVESSKRCAMDDE